MSAQLLTKSRLVDNAVDQALNGIALGTAAMGSGAGFLKPMSGGDFWLGFNENGMGVSFRDNRHVLICAGTRGGKGVSLIVSNLCLWPGSIVVIDPKGENAMVTARRRGNGSRFCWGMGQKVRILDPMNVVRTPDDSFEDLKAGYNPLTLIDPRNPESLDIASRIAEALVVSENSSDPYWEDAARALIRNVILYVATGSSFRLRERNLVTVRRLLVAGDAEARKLALTVSKDGKAPSGHHFLFKAMGRSQAFGSILAHAGEMYEALEQDAPRQFHSIKQVAVTNTDFIDSEGMAACLSRHDFALRELKTGQKGLSLYISLPQRYVETHNRWLRMMVSLITAEMERELSRPATGHSVLMMLDEFPALRRMRVIENAAAQIAGYGVKMVFAVQTLAQLKDIYKDNWETIIANCGVKAFFCNDDHFTREYVSKLMGDTETMRPTFSRTVTFGESESATAGSSWGNSFSSTTGVSGQQMSWSGTSGWSRTYNTSVTRAKNSSHGETVSTTIHKRALRTPDEIGRHYGDASNPRALVIVSGQQPVEIRRSLYYRERWFEGLFDPHRDHKPPMDLLALSDYQDRRLVREVATENRRCRQAWEAQRESRREAEECAEARRKLIRRANLRFNLMLGVFTAILSTIMVVLVAGLMRGFDRIF